MSEQTFAQAIFEGAKAAANTEAGKQELQGLNHDQFIAAVGAFTKALDSLDGNINMHVMLLAITYLRNVLIVAMRENQRTLEQAPGGSA